MAFYGDDLAYVHHVGFTGFVRGAAPGLIAMLREAGINEGLVVDLGCGSGVWLQTLIDAGYRAIGVDGSSAMLRLARRNAPQAKLHRASAFEFDLPPCDAVTAIGEVLCYLPVSKDGRVPSRKDQPLLSALLGRIAQALRPGGLLLFDLMIHSDDSMVMRNWRAGDDWAAMFESSDDRKRELLTREITTFRRVGRTYRRSHERHVVRVYKKEQVLDLLERADFQASAMNSYGRFPMLPRRMAFHARRV